MIDINIFLFGKPEWMMDLKKAKPEDFMNLGFELWAWLDRVSEIIEELEKNGWSRSACLYNLYYSKETTLKKAKKELKDLGIDLEEVCLHKWEGE